MTSAQILTVAGPLIVGYLLNWGLFGVLSVQVYIYSLAFPKDRIYNKLLVVGVYILEVAQSVLMAEDAFRTFASGFGSVETLTSSRLIGIMLPIINGFVAFSVQAFYGNRIRLFSKSNIIPILIFVLSLIQLAGALMSGIRSQIAGNVTKLVSLHDRIGHALFDASTVACDILIAGCITYSLYRTKPAIRCTQALVSRIIFLSVGTGIVTGKFPQTYTFFGNALTQTPNKTATMAVTDLALYYAWPKTAIFIPPVSVLGKLYSNSMMVMLNSRATIHVEKQYAGSVMVNLIPNRQENIYASRAGPLSLPRWTRSDKENTSLKRPIDVLVSQEPPLVG